MSRHRKWTPEEDRRCIECAKRGWYTERIAEDLHRGVADVSRRRAQLGCAVPRKRGRGDRLTQAEIGDILYRYYKQEQSMNTISRETGISLVAVRRHVNKYVDIKRK